MLSRLSTSAMWSPDGKGLTSWFLFVMFNCVFVTFPCGILGQVWYLIVSIPDLCSFYFFVVTFQLWFRISNYIMIDSVYNCALASSVRQELLC